MLPEINASRTEGTCSPRPLMQSRLLFVPLRSVHGSKMAVLSAGCCGRPFRPKQLLR